MRRIKRLNEGFAEDVSGGGFNSSNGVFKVSYIPYKDLSKPLGRDVVKNATPHSKYQIGDIVSGKTISNKKIEGAIVRIQNRPDNKGKVFYVKDTETNEIHKINPYSISMVNDIGNVLSKSVLNTTFAKNNTEMTRYSNNPVAWGSFENKKEVFDSPLYENKSSIDPEYTINYEDRNSEYDIAIPAELKNDYTERVKYEAKEIAKRKLKDAPEAKGNDLNALCDLWAVKKLQEISAEFSYKPIIANFLDLHRISYGEFQDKNLELINKYL